jgi:hypothetical protein
MKASGFFASSLLALCAWVLPGGAAAGEVLPDSITFISGTRSFVDTYDLTTAGTLSVMLSDIAWPGDLQTLGAFVTTSSGVVIPDFSPGKDAVIVGPGQVSIQWFGIGTGALKAGQFGLDVQFQPGCTTAVPLPGSLAAFASGLLLIAFLGRRRQAGLRRD